MASTTYTGLQNGRWTDSTNWSNGAPAPGETAIVNSNVGVSTGDLALYNTTVEVGGGGAMIGNVLALADSSIVGPGLLGLVVQQDIIADRMSFVGIPAAATTGGLDVQTAMYINLGTVGAEVCGRIPAWSYMDRKIKGECRLKRLW